MRRNFQGYTEDGAEVLIGLGASAISRLPAGLRAERPHLLGLGRGGRRRGASPTERGHAMTADDRLRADMIERLMCRFELDLRRARGHATTCRWPELLRADGRASRAPLRRLDRGATAGRIRLARAPRLIARLAALEIDAYAMPAGRHARAV